MKKIITILFLMFLTGCSSKNETLNCVMSNELYGNNIVQTVDAFFIKGKISIINMKHEITLNEENAEYAEVYKSKIDEQFDSFKNKNGITVNLDEKDNIIILDVHVDVSKTDAEANKTLGFSISGSYNKSREALEKEGYVCQ